MRFSWRASDTEWLNMSEATSSINTVLAGSRSDPDPGFRGTAHRSLRDHAELDVDVVVSCTVLV